MQFLVFIYVCIYYAADCTFKHIKLKKTAVTLPITNNF